MTTGAGEREALQARWFELTREEMPAAAKARAGDERWPVHLDHCFQRILLDNACGGRWTDHVERPAYVHAPDTILRDAIALGERALKGEADLWQLDDSSLGWRGKPMKAKRRMPRPAKRG